MLDLMKILEWVSNRKRQYEAKGDVGSAKVLEGLEVELTKLSNEEEARFSNDYMEKEDETRKYI